MQRLRSDMESLNLICRVTQHEGIEFIEESGGPEARLKKAKAEEGMAAVLFGSAGGVMRGSW
jgi:hypothetical protein